MSEMTIKMLLNLSKNWPDTIIKFYNDFKDNINDISFERLLTTLIDQENHYFEYFKENLEKLNFELDFQSKSNDLFDFRMLDDNAAQSKDLSKPDFLKKAINFHEISISNYKILENLAVTDSARQIFKELSDEEHRYMMLLKDRLELEELF